MLHQKGNRVDVDALHDRIPLRQDAGKCPNMGSHGNRSLWQWKSVFVDAFGGLEIYVNIQDEELGQGSHEGSTRQGSAPYPPGRALHPCGRLAALLTCTPSLLVVFWSKKNQRESFILFGLCLVFLFCKTLKLAEKTENGTGPQVTRLVPKII